MRVLLVVSPTSFDNNYDAAATGHLKKEDRSTQFKKMVTFISMRFDSAIFSRMPKKSHW